MWKDIDNSGSTYIMAEHGIMLKFIWKSLKLVGKKINQ